MDFWYDFLIFLLQIILKLFFKISVRGFRFVPSTGPIIFIAAPHANQFVDPCMLQITSKRRIGFLAAASSMRKTVIGFLARHLNSIPVERPQDLAKVGQGRIYWDCQTKSLKGVGTLFKNQIHCGDHISIGGTDTLVVAKVVSDDQIIVRTGPIGTDYPNNYRNAAFGYKITPRVDQSSMFTNVTRRLAESKCVGIFPEGGSHDRSELLPLKPGVAIMALNVLSEYPLINLTIVPVGLNYFQAHKFRSRAVVEYGKPIVVDDKIVEMYGKGGELKKEAISQFMSLVGNSLSEITLNAPNLEMLQIIQTTRRLYTPVAASISPEESLLIARAIALGYEKCKDDPRVISLRTSVAEYNRMLHIFGLSDHQVKLLTENPYRALFRLISQSLIFCICLVISLPGLVLFSPIYIVTSHVSYSKAKQALKGSSVKITGSDVIATWKILTALIVVPVCIICYTLLAFIITGSVNFTISAIFLTPIASLITLVVSDIAFESFLRIYPLILSLSKKTRITQIRKSLAHRIRILINEIGPSIIDNFEEKRIFKRGDLESEEDWFFNDFD